MSPSTEDQHNIPHQTRIDELLRRIADLEAENEQLETEIERLKQELKIKNIRSN